MISQEKTPGRTSSGLYNFLGVFQVKCHHRCCKDPLGSFQGVFLCDIIDCLVYLTYVKILYTIWQMSKSFELTYMGEV